VIDFLALMLVSLAAGFVVLAHYLYVNPDHDERQSWASAFFAAGLIGTLTSVPIVIGWPLPGAYNIAFGEPALFLSVAFLGAAAALAFKWEPLFPALFGFFGGIIAIVVGIRIMDLGMTQEPALTMIGYVSAGIGGCLTLPAINWRHVRWIALTAAVALGIAAAVFLLTGYEAYWGHLVQFAKYAPK